MKVNRILQTLLLALLVVGVFAAMAKNAYGFTFMGIACFGLALVYVTQLIWRLIDDYTSLGRKDLPGLMELFLLSGLLLLFGLRASYIYLANGESIFILTCLLLAVVYLSISYDIHQISKKENQNPANAAFFFYSSIPLFLLALGSRTINIILSSVFGVLGVLVALPFLWSLLRQEQINSTGKSVSLFHYISSSKNKAGLLFIFFIASALYTGLTYLSVIPEITNAESPKDYIELVHNAESGKEKPVDGKYQHQVYKEAMDKFLKRHAGK